MVNLEQFIRNYAWKFDNNVVLISAITRLCRDRKITPQDACELIENCIATEYGEQTAQDVHDRLLKMPNWIALLELSFGSDYRKPQTLQGGEK